jgi:hypothetical protein
VALSATAVCPTQPPGGGGESSPRPAQEALAYDAITSVSVDEHIVRVNGEPFVTCREAHQAATLAQLLRHLAGLPASARPKAVRDMLAAGMNTDSLRSDLTLLATTGRLLRVLCNTLFLYLFLVVPALLALFSLFRLWPILASVLGVLVLVIAVEFRDIHAWLWPVEKGARRSALTRMGFYPPTAIRAHDYLAHRLCAGYHPLTVAFLVCAPPVFHRFARQVVRQLHYPLAGSSPNPALAATEQWFRSAQEEAIRRALAACGLDIEAYLRPPARTGESGLAYCPRCDTEYAVAGGTCADCPGVALVSFDPRTPQAVMEPRTARVAG